MSTKKKLTDLKRISGSLTGMLKQGLTGFFQRQARPTDNKTILFFVVGGITCEEACYLKEIAKENPDYNVLIGSTAITTPKTITNAFFNYSQFQ